LHLFPKKNYKRKSSGPSSSVTGERKITNYGTKGERKGKGEREGG